MPRWGLVSGTLWGEAFDEDESACFSGYRCPMRQDGNSDRGHRHSSDRSQANSTCRDCKTELGGECHSEGRGQLKWVRSARRPRSAGHRVGCPANGAWLPWRGAGQLRGSPQSAGRPKRQSFCVRRLITNCLSVCLFVRILWQQIFTSKNGK